MWGRSRPGAALSADSPLASRSPLASLHISRQSMLVDHSSWTCVTLSGCHFEAYIRRGPLGTRVAAWPDRIGLRASCSLVLRMGKTWALEPCGQWSPGRRPSPRQLSVMPRVSPAGRPARFCRGLGSLQQRVARNAQHPGAVEPLCALAVPLKAQCLVRGPRLPVSWGEGCWRRRWPHSGGCVDEMDCCLMRCILPGIEVGLLCNYG